MLHTKYQSYRPCGFCQEDFSNKKNILVAEVFLSTTVIDLHARNIPAEFQQIWPSGSGGEIV